MTKPPARLLRRITLITETPVGGGPPRLRSWRLEWVAAAPAARRKKAQLSQRATRNTGRTK